MEEQLNLEEIPPVSKPLEADPQYKLIVQLSSVSCPFVVILYCFIVNYLFKYNIVQDVRCCYDFCSN